MRITTDSVTLDVQVEGEGTPVVLLHGWPDSKRLWSNQVPALVDAGYRVIVPDQRGYGASDKPEEVEAYSIVFLAMDVVAILDKLEVPRAHVVGHDWGAAIAWATASFSPDRVDKLAVMSVGHPSAFADAGFEQRAASWYMLLFNFPGIAEQWLSMNDWANFRAWAQHPHADAVIAELEANGSLTPGLNYYRATVPPETLVNPPLELPPIQSPVMGMWSSNDFALTEAQMTGSAKYCNAGFRYERIDGPGHWMQLEAPDKVNALLLDFLKG
jgi:pimeloyl-ACP methyl ester carboxylesterase